MWTLLLPLALAGDGFDHTYAQLASVYEGAVGTDGVDYDTIRARRATLDAALAAIAEAPVDTFTDEQKLALYVNAYNAYTVTVILDAWPVTSIKTIDGVGPWKTRRFPVGGEQLTLDQMEHQHARKLADGRVHGVINCASVGCPPLPPAPLSPTGIDGQLTAYAQRWVRTNAWTLDGEVVGLSKIFSWYAEDFVAWGEGVDVAAANPAQDAAIGFVRTFGGEVPEAPTKVVWQDYDWSLNQR